MAIIGFNFTKISAEKPRGKLTGKVSITNNVSIQDVKEMEVSVGAKDTRGLLIDFSYVCTYENAGKVSLEGNVVSVETQETIESALAEWKKSKSIGKELTQSVMSYVLQKSTVQSILLSKEVGLPAPIPLPKLEKTATSSSKKK